MSLHERAGASIQDLLQHIRLRPKELFGDKFWDTRVICPVDAALKADRFEARILAISKFRVFLLSGKTQAKLKVDTSFHLLSIRAIEVVGEAEVRVSLADEKRVWLRAAAGAAGGHELAVELLKAFKHYFPGCTDSLSQWLRLAPAELFERYSTLPYCRPELPCANFRRTYAALCDFYALPFRDEVVWVRRAADASPSKPLFVQDIEKIYATHGYTALRLDDFTHLAADDLLPIVAVLQYSQWFTGLSLDGIKLGGRLLDVVVGVVQRSQSLTQLKLRNCALQRDFLVSFVHAVSTNSSIPLETVDLSQNVFDEHKAVIQLGTSLPVLAGGLKTVSLANCALNAKGLNGLCNGLFLARLASPPIALRKLDVSGNSIKDEANELYNLVAHSNGLTYLNISDTGLGIDKLWSALKSGGLQLEKLCIAHCQFTATKKSKDSPAVPAGLKDFFSSAVSLKSVDVSDVNLTGEILKQMLLGLACNKALSEVRVDLSRSCTDRACVAVFETTLPNVDAIGELVLRDNSLDNDLLALMPVFGRMSRLYQLDLGGNNFGRLHKQPKSALQSVLIELVKAISDDDCAIRDLVLSDCHLGAHTAVLLNALGVAPHLRRLDLTANEMRNFGARLLAKALQINTSLETLLVDRNHLGFEAFVDMAHALKTNRTLLNMPYPLFDAADAVHHGPDKHRVHDTLCKIESLLLRNRGFARWRDGRRTEGQSDSTIYSHSRLLVSSVEEDITRAIYMGQQIINQSSANSDSHTEQLKELVSAAESLKQIIRASREEDDDAFIAEAISSLSKDLTERAVGELRAVRATFVSGLERQRSHLPSLEESAATVERRLNAFDLSALLDDARAQAERHFGDARNALLNALVERLVSDLLPRLHAEMKRLTELAKSGSQGSLNQNLSAPSSANVTPKSNRKWRMFSRTARPKSIVQGESVPMGNSVELSISEMSDATSAMSHSVHRGADTESLGSIQENDVFDDDEPTVAASAPLKSVLKSRPKRPNKRASRPPPPSAGHQFTVGVDQFFAADLDRPAEPTPPPAPAHHAALASSPSPPTKTAPLPPTMTSPKAAALPPKPPAVAPRVNAASPPPPPLPERRRPQSPSVSAATPPATQELQRLSSDGTPLSAAPVAPPNTPATPGGLKLTEVDLVAACQQALNSADSHATQAPPAQGVLPPRAFQSVLRDDATKLPPLTETSERPMQVDSALMSRSVSSRLPTDAEPVAAAPTNKTDLSQRYSVIGGVSLGATRPAAVQAEPASKQVEVAENVRLRNGSLSVDKGDAGDGDSDRHPSAPAKPAAKRPDKDQRKSVIEMTSMFERQADTRPVAPPRSRNKVAPADEMT